MVRNLGAFHSKFARGENVPDAKVTDVKFVLVKGAPSFRVALERLQLGFIADEEAARWRKAFSRFSLGEEDIDKHCLSAALTHLGFLVDDDLLASSADKVTSLSSFDLQEFVSFLEYYASGEKEMIETAFKKHAGGATGTIAITDVTTVFRELHIVLLHRVLEELLHRASLTKRSEINFDEFIQVIAAYRVCEGFAVKDSAELQEAFAKEAEDEKLNISDLPNVLLDCFGVHCIKHLRELVSDSEKILSYDGPGATPAYLHECLVWARQLRGAQLWELYESFDNVDDDGDGMISLEELISMFKLEGFTLTEAVANELLHAAGFDAGNVTRFSFDDAVAALSVCQEKEGFGQQDLDELLAAYQKFDVESEGEITTFQVLDLLRFLGYQVQVKDVEKYARQVDYNQNGTMDVNEYLRLMRLHREDELDAAHTVFYRLSRNTPCLPFNLLHRALREAEVCPSHCDVFDEVCQKILGSKPVDLTFTEFVDLAAKSRHIVKHAMTERANFSDAEFGLLKESFKNYDVTGKGTLSSIQLVSLLNTCGVQVLTAADRNDVVEMLDKAREAAVKLERSAEEVGEFGSFSTTFFVMVHACRLIARDNESRQIQRLDEARTATNFSVAEMEDFKKIFAQWVKSGAPKALPVSHERGRFGRRNSLPDLQVSKIELDTEGDGDTCGSNGEELSLESIVALGSAAEHLPFHGLKGLLGHLKLKLSASNSWSLENKVLELTGSREGALDIANFIYLMRWMLDINFASVNEKAAFVAKKALRIGPMDADADVRKSSKKPRSPKASPTGPEPIQRSGPSLVKARRVSV